MTAEEEPLTAIPEAEQVKFWSSPYFASTLMVITLDEVPSASVCSFGASRRLKISPDLDHSSDMSGLKPVTLHFRLNFGNCSDVLVVQREGSLSVSGFGSCSSHSSMVGLDASALITIIKNIKKNRKRSYCTRIKYVHVRILGLEFNYHGI